MPITENDIKLLQSARMTDTPDGGGRMTGNVVQSGVDNNIFDDVSNLDRVYGNGSLRKLFLALLTNTTEKYLGARIIIDEPPKDAAVECVLFSASSLFDTRDAAKARLEAYLAASAPYQGLLYGPHIVGMMSVMLIQQLDRALPGISDTLLLRKTVGAEVTDQYVRITGVASAAFKFTDSAGDYERRIVTCTVGDALRHDFDGWEARRIDSDLDYGTKARVYTTLVANAAQYFGIRPLTSAAAMGAYNIKADTAYSALVPSAQLESPLVDLNGSGIAVGNAATGTTIAYSVTTAFTTTTPLTLGAGVAPGTLTLQLPGGVVIEDSGYGALLVGGIEVGAIDYTNGASTLSDSTYNVPGGTILVAFEIGAKALLSLQSDAIPVTLASRGLSYVAALSSKPAPGTLSVSYLAGGRWYNIKDRGDGAIKGAVGGLGAGNVNYATRSVSLTLGALPDVGSHIILQWGMQESVTTVTAAGSITSGADLIFSAGFQDAYTDSVSVSWHDGTPRAFSWSAATGSAGTDGVFHEWAGVKGIKFNVLPPKGTVVTATGNRRVTTPHTYAAPSTALFTLPNAPVVRGSVRLAGIEITQTFSIADWNGIKTRLATLGSGGLSAVINFADNNQTVIIRYQASLLDNGQGALVAPPHVYGSAFMTFGALDYSTGTVTIDPATAVSFQPAWDGPRIFGWGDEGEGLQASWAGFGGAKSGSTVIAAQATTATYLTGGLETFSTSAAVNELAFGLRGLPTGYTLSSLTFKVGSATHQRDAADTTKIVRNPSPLTGAGTVVGSVDGTRVVLTDWAAGTPGEVTEFAAVAAVTTSAAADSFVSDRMVFRAANAPLRPGSFTVQGRMVGYSGGDPTSFSATADANGVINTSNLVGFVDYQTGICFLYGRAAAVHSVAEIPLMLRPAWTAPIAGFPGNWQPGLLVPSSVTYNAVSYAYLPLDATILGLDPVRLPSDGRVPIFKSGRVVVVHNTIRRSPQTVSNGQTVDCGRTRLARIRVFGADGLEITSGFTKGLDAGTVTFTNVAGFSQPVVVEHRIEDEALCADAQITGDLRLTRPLTHDFPAHTSYVSSAYVVGTLQAAAQDSFAQTTWTNEWRDTRIGPPILAQYNDTAHPIAVTNAGAITERWLFQFTSNTEFNVIGEEVGQIITGNTATVLAPMNPATGVPYFVLQPAGWGSGWVAGNCLRRNTTGAIHPLWIARSVQQSPSAPPGTDQMTLSVRGDIDQ